MLTGRPERLKAFPYLGFQRYFLTFCTEQRRRIFTAPEPVDLVLSQIDRAAMEQQFALLAYCFMPDHLHLLVTGETEAADGRQFIRKAKQYSGYYYSKTFGARLWQHYAYEHVLRREEDTRRIARYVIENPVRAGLATCVQDYPFVGSRLFSVTDLIEGVSRRS